MTDTFAAWADCSLMGTSAAHPYPVYVRPDTPLPTLDDLAELISPRPDLCPVGPRTCMQLAWDAYVRACGAESLAWAPMHDYLQRVRPDNALEDSRFWRLACALYLLRS